MPEFGGSSSVWSASMLFYQGMLLLGYLYAHGLSKLKLHSQFIIHAFLLLLSTLITLNGESVQYSNNDYPALAVIGKLTTEIGLAFFLLAATSVLLQQWYCRTSHTEVPYHWYSFSNLASLISLVSYPFFFEAYLPTSEQKHYWFELYVITVILKLVLMASLYTVKPSKPVNNKTPQPNSVHRKQVLLWITLSATSSIMLIATTQLMSINIPPMPLVWLLPLLIYLASYTFCFSSKKTYKRTKMLPLLFAAIFFGLIMYFLGSQFNTLSQLIIYSLILLVCCIICHGELRSRAPASDSMTTFYVATAMGGALGSLFSSIIAPLIFERITEYVLGLFLVVIVYICNAPRAASQKTRMITNFGGICVLTTLLVCYLYIENRFDQYDVATVRNFYGYVTVKDVTAGNIAERRLVDGTTVHGSEPLKLRSASESSYYQQTSGVAVAVNYLQQRESINLGVIGLGAGVLASYIRPNDSITFFELNPAVYEMANKYFSYLKNAQGSVTVNVDDGRIAIARQLNSSKQKFNAIIVDAFSSDAIPAHLLTREAFNIYWQRLEEDGLLIIHISNNHIDLMPVLLSHATYFDKAIFQWRSTAQLQSNFGSDWVVLTNDHDFTAEHFPFQANSTRSNSDLAVEWTDEKYSLLPLIRL
ncbi:fused MFS/spermidine synthase [Alteromonas confluentis]|uniref:fused MFS/spermidine synthase n=1 Tax=Alteromonas confluentis TaxID=1656094 RepID=UPI000A61BF78|nr:fused MFS/spermidine synthase [Alteromonas confluentis]